MVEIHAFLTFDDVSEITRDILLRHVPKGAYLATKLVAKLKEYQKNNTMPVGEDRYFSFAIMELSLQVASLLSQLSKLPIPESNRERAFDCNISNRQVFFLVADNPHFVSVLHTKPNFDMKDFLDNYVAR